MSSFSFIPVEDDALVILDTSPSGPIGKSWKFDFQSHQFSGAGHGPLATYRTQTLYGWIEKCLQTDLGASPVSPRGYGLERVNDWIGMPIGRLGDLEERVRRALTFHPRIEDIRDFSYTFDPDEEAVDVEFTAVLTEDTLLPVRVTF